MGCFTVLKSKKKKPEQGLYVKRVNPQGSTPSPTILPEPPKIQTRSLQSAPPSFRTRAGAAKPVVVQPTNKRVINNRSRTLSAPSSLNAAEEDDSVELYEEQEDPKTKFGSMKEQSSPSPQPLPLPSPQTSRSNSFVVLKYTSSFKMANMSGPLNVSGPLPLPPNTTITTPPPLGSLRSFSYEEIASACHNFSPERCMSEGISSAIYRASFGEDKKLEATIARLHPSTQSLKEFVNEVNTLSTLQHPYLCKLLGFHAREGSERRMLVYERLFHGSLDKLLYGRSDGPPIDWNARMKVALCAAQGLTFLHEEGPFQAMFSEFSTGYIQIDKDFSAKLSGYGCIGPISDEITTYSNGTGNLSVETLERGLVTPKSNVWSFGIVLLELLTGRKNLDSRRPKEERYLMKWSKPYLADDSRLSLIMDPQLKGRYPSKAARMVADIAQRCLQLEPSERPTMRTIVDHLKVIQEMRFTSRFPLQEPGSFSGKNMIRSPSLNAIPARLSSSSQSPPANRRTLSPTRPIGLPLSFLPPLSCLEEIDRQESRKSPSQRSSVEGF